MTVKSPSAPQKTPKRKQAPPAVAVIVAAGEGTVRVLRAIERAGELVVQRWAEAPDGGDPEARAHAIAQALQQAEITERSITLLLPARSVVIKRVQLPPATPEQLPQLVLFEAQRHLPLPLEQLATGFQPLPPRPGAPGTEVLLAVTRRGELARLEKALAALRISVEGYAVEALAVADAYLPVGEPHLNGEARLVLTPSGGGLHAQVLREKRLLFTRFLPFSGDWNGDLRRSLTAYAVDEPELPIGDAILVGELDDPQLSSALGFPVRHAALSPAQGGELKLAPDWGPAVGAARQRLGLGSYPLRIEPQGWEARAPGPSRSRMALTVLGVVAALLLLAAWQMDARQRQAETARKADRLARQTEQNRKLLGKLNTQREQLREQWKAITGRDPRSVLSGGEADTPPLDLLQKVSGQAPPGVWLTHMEYERGRPIQFEGTARDASEVTRFLHTLSGLSGFKRVELGFLRSAELDKTPVTHFRLDCYTAGSAGDALERRGKAGE